MRGPWGIFGVGLQHWPSRWQVERSHWLVHLWIQSRPLWCSNMLKHKSYKQTIKLQQPQISSHVLQGKMTVFIKAVWWIWLHRYNSFSSLSVNPTVTAVCLCTKQSMSLIPSHRRHIVFVIFHILQADDKHKQSTGCDMTSVSHRIVWLMNTTAFFILMKTEGQDFMQYCDPSAIKWPGGLYLWINVKNIRHETAAWHGCSREKKRDHWFSVPAALGRFPKLMCPVLAQIPDAQVECHHSAGTFSNCRWHASHSRPAHAWHAHNKTTTPNK